MTFERAQPGLDNSFFRQYTNVPTASPKEQARKARANGPVRNVASVDAGVYDREMPEATHGRSRMAQRKDQGPRKSAAIVTMKGKKREESGCQTALNCEESDVSASTGREKRLTGEEGEVTVRPKAALFWPCLRRRPIGFSAEPLNR